MQDEQQFEQLMLQYRQLKNGSEDIRKMIEGENFDSALTMIQSREPIFHNCKCMLRYLELTPSQQKELDTLLDELRESERQNIDLLSKGLAEVKRQLHSTQKTEKVQKAYGYAESQQGTIANYEE